MMSKINRNAVEGNTYGERSAGGAIFLNSNSSAEIADCELLENVARGSRYAYAGIERSHDPKRGPVLHCVITP